MPKLRKQTKSNPAPLGRSALFTEKQAKEEIALVVKEQGESFRKRQAHALGTKRHVLNYEDIDTLIDNLSEERWQRVRCILQGETVDLYEFREILNAQAIDLGWKRKVDTDIAFNIRSIRDWVRQQKMGDIAIELQKGLAPYRGLPTRAILEKIVYECYDQSEKIRQWLFESGAANLSDAELLKAYPQLQAAAIKGIESLNKLNEHQLKKGSQLDGARRMAYAIYEVIKGTQLENIIASIVADVILEIEAEDEITPNG